MRRVLLCLAVLLVVVAAATAQPLNEVPAGHWSYGAVDALMQRGLVYGYPPQAYRGPTPLTRAEMAGLVARAVRGAGAAMQMQGWRLEVMAQAPGATTPAAAPVSPDTVPEVTPEDIARIEKLLAEFRNELVTTGAKVDDVIAEIAKLKGAQADTRKQVDTLAKEAARHKLSGWTQVRYTVDGSATPESEFTVKRARVGLSGPLAPKSSYRLQFDLPSQTRSTQSTARLVEAYATLAVSARSRLLVGQFGVPFGWEIYTRARDLDTPEGALGTERLFPDERYDRGLRLDADLGGKWQGWAAVINGAGYKRGETNDRKDVVLRVAHADGGLEYGASAYLGEDTQPAEGSTPRAEAHRNLFGLHVIARLGQTQLKGEVVTGQAAGASAIAQGAKDVLAWTVLGSYDLRPDTTLALRFHRFDPNRDRADDGTDETTLVFTRRLNDALRLRFAEDFVRPQAGGSYNIFTSELRIVY